MVLLISGCKSNDYLLIEPVKGIVISASDKKPLGEARIYVDKGAFNVFDTIRTSNDGHFFVEKITMIILIRDLFSRAELD